MTDRRDALARAEETLPAAEEQARQHERVRAAHGTEVIEDYAELIADRVDSQGEARALALAQRFGVAQPTVAKMLRRLQQQSLIVRERYRAIHLTEEGRALAEAARRRHALVLDFLRKLGASEARARRDADGIEHHASAEILEAMRRFLEQNGERGRG